MSLLDKAVYRLMNGKKAITRPIFIKDFERENQQLMDLIELSDRVKSNKKKLIDKDIALLKYGMDGEQNVYYELKNSFIPMLCLHDIRLEYNGYAAQFDFIVITSKYIYVIETKKLSGDVEINSDGDFIRILKNGYGKIIKKEGMYSPISQNKRHVNILKEILINEGVIRTLPIESAVVIANAKTIVKKDKAPKEISNVIYKYDQIVNLLNRELNDKNNEKNMLEKYMYQIANFLMDHHKPITYDYMAKYSLTEGDFQKEDPVMNLPPSDLYNDLKEYRLRKSKEENKKAFMVFTNEMLDTLTKMKPKSKDELRKIKGFGDKKVEQYGDEIISIINR
ncbi:NERD domain-containing protein [Niallia sp. XMNu-256]|uniref:NERD domain-containing protein n=1 Tax=Niallia sp. XMNu-256 TaxID=3082444 RepID=UPI0030CDDDA0